VRAGAPAKFAARGDKEELSGSEWVAAWATDVLGEVGQGAFFSLDQILSILSQPDHVSRPFSSLAERSPQTSEVRRRTLKLTCPKGGYRSGSPHYEVSIVEGVVSRTFGFWEEPNARDPHDDDF
jgi:hypothetical protein